MKIETRLPEVEGLLFTWRAELGRAYEGNPPCKKLRLEVEFSRYDHVLRLTCCAPGCATVQGKWHLHNERNGRQKPENLNFWISGLECVSGKPRRRYHLGV